MYIVLNKAKKKKIRVKFYNGMAINYSKLVNNKNYIG